VKVRIAVGEVELRTDGLDLSARQVRDLLNRAAMIAAAMTIAANHTEDEPKQPVGFTAQVERLPEEIPQEDLSWYFDE
jgi:hypothetical protein